MLRQFAARIPLVERLRAGFVAAGAAGTLAAPYRPQAWLTTTASAPPSAAAAAAATGGGGGGGNDDPVARFNALFSEARDEIEYAREDAETTYFNESVATAKEAVNAALEAWADALNNQPDDAARGALQRGNGLKVEQLKAELQALDEIHA